MLLISEVTSYSQVAPTGKGKYESPTGSDCEHPANTSMAEMKDKRFIITSPACVLQAHR
jgi:hypothetical protein